MTLKGHGSDLLDLDRLLINTLLQGLCVGKIFIIINVSEKHYYILNQPASKHGHSK